jgi:hypothetical protein
MLADTVIAQLLECLVGANQFAYQRYGAVFAGLCAHACVSE